MSDALDDLLYEFRDIRFHFDEIFRRMNGQAAERSSVYGEVGKWALRSHIEELRKRFGLSVLSWPDHPTYSVSERNHRIEIHNGSKLATTIDTAQVFERRPLIIDIKMNEWGNLERSYFREQHPRKRGVLDEVFGKGNYDHALLVPYAMTKWHRDSNIVRIRCSAEEFREQVDAECEKRGV